MKLFLTGGFLGSGKTTAIQQACTALLADGIRTGVITNDQGAQLVDTGYIRNAGIPVTEVPNGCFCCNYDQLESSIQSLQETGQPEIIFAESVGSCTDLVATVLKPMLKFHPDIKVVISVFADAGVLPVLINGSRLFADSVNYIYKKQLEEADVIVVNKVDLITKTQLEHIRQLMQARYPDKTVLYQNSLVPEDVRHWIAVLNDFRPAGSRESLDIDYGIYGAGEAGLAWLDEEIEIEAGEGNAVEVGAQLINGIYSSISKMELPVGHLKFLLNDGRQQEKISFTAINQAGFRYEPASLQADAVKILINARVQTEPYLLKKTVSDVLDKLVVTENCKITRRNTTVFQPGYPKPAYRIVNEINVL